MSDDVGRDRPEPDMPPLARLRAEPENPHGFRGFGPLVALVVLLVLVVLLAPTVAPERFVLVPTDETTTTVTTTTPSTSTSTTVTGEAP